LSRSSATSIVSRRRRFVRWRKRAPSGRPRLCHWRTPATERSRSLSTAAGEAAVRLGVATGRLRRDLATRARAKQLNADEVRGATFTITNPGAYGALIATPIMDLPRDPRSGGDRSPANRDDRSGRCGIDRDPPNGQSDPRLGPPRDRRDLRGAVPQRPPQTTGNHKVSTLSWRVSLRSAHGGRCSRVRWFRKIFCGQCTLCAECRWDVRGS